MKWENFFFPDPEAEQNTTKLYFTYLQNIQKKINGKCVKRLCICDESENS
jgi:hypothetical protein